MRATILAVRQEVGAHVGLALVRLVIRSDLCARRRLLRRAQRIHALMLRSDTNTRETDQLLAELDLAGGVLRTST